MLGETCWPSSPCILRYTPQRRESNRWLCPAEGCVGSSLGPHWVCIRQSRSHLPSSAPRQQSLREMGPARRRHAVSTGCTSLSGSGGPSKANPTWQVRWNFHCLKRWVQMISMVKEWGSPTSPWVGLWAQHPWAGLSPLAPNRLPAESSILTLPAISG